MSHIIAITVGRNATERLGIMATPKGTAPKAAKKVLEGTVVPDGVKQPEDRKSKAQNETHRVVTVRGKEWSVPLEALDDFELLDDLNMLDQKGDPTRLPSVLRRMLGDQWKDAMDSIRDPDTGRVTVTAGAEFVMEFMGALDPNSQGS